MISDVLNLVRWEWFKLVRRWMPWILLAIMVLFTQLGVWGTYFVYQGESNSGGEIPYGTFGEREGPRGLNTVRCSDLRSNDLPADLQNARPEIIEGLLQQCTQMEAGRQEQLGRIRSNFVIPSSIAGAYGNAGMIFIILFSILAASTFGMDYGTGTLRPILARGTGRWEYLTAKFITLALVLAGGLLMVAVTVGASSLVADGLLGSTAAPVVDADTWLDTAKAFGKAWFSILPYVALTAFVATLAKSSAAGIAVGLAYYFGELIVYGLFSNFFDWVKNIGKYLLGQNTSAFTGAFSFGGGGGIGGEAISTTHAFFVLLAYLVVLAGLAFWIFQRRDVAGASGG